MGDYTYIQQAESVLSSLKGQLSDEELPMYHGAASTGEIPMHLPPDFIDQIEKLGIVGGGSMPTRLKSYVRDGLLYVSWEQSDGDVREYEVSYEPFNDDTDPDSPRVVNQRGSSNEIRLDDIIISVKYLCRVRALNLAGWGVWSHPVVGWIEGFPLEIRYTGEIVTIELPRDGVYSILSFGAKAADGTLRKGGRGAIIGANFKLEK